MSKGFQLKLKKLFKNCNAIGIPSYSSEENGVINGKLKYFTK
jgi:hypothetical protein